MFDCSFGARERIGSRWQVAVRRTLVGLFIVALAFVAVTAPVDAAKKPKTGTWFSEHVDPDDDSNFSSVRFKVIRKGKELKKVTIFWRCRKLSGYHNFRSLPFPIGINKKKRYKLVGATTPPAGQSSKDFTLKGRFTSRKKGRYSMKLKGCGPKTKGKIALS